ncbi:MAG: transposase [Pseudomonadota bacterium]
MVSTIEMMDTIVARVAKRQQRRFWTTEQKRRIVAEARAYGASVARRHHLNANLLFTWMRDPQFAEEASAPVLLPVEIVDEAQKESPVAATAATRRSPIEIEAPGGMRVRCDDTVDEATLVRVLSAIRRAS